MLRWLLRELSTDVADMMAFATSLGECDDEDAQALLEELLVERMVAPVGPLQTVYKSETQVIRPHDVVLTLDIPRASFYALVKRGAFPAPISLDDTWLGWPRDVVLDWADESARERLGNCSRPGYAPFERCVSRGSR